MRHCQSIRRQFKEWGHACAASKATHCAHLFVCLFFYIFAPGVNMATAYRRPKKNNKCFWSLSDEQGRRRLLQLWRSRLDRFHQNVDASQRRRDPWRRVNTAALLELPSPSTNHRRSTCRRPAWLALPFFFCSFLSKWGPKWWIHCLRLHELINNASNKRSALKFRLEIKPEKQKAVRELRLKKGRKNRTPIGFISPFEEGRQCEGLPTGGG